MTSPFALFESFTWWARLSNAQQFFYGIGILAGILTLIMALLALFGIGSDDVDIGDAAGAGDHLEGSSLFSTKPITGFFLAFGWSGGIALDAGLSLGLATVIAFGSGTVLMFALAWVIRSMYSLRNDGTRQINDAIGA